ncbi:MAG: hypothetical protein V4844_05340 [Pseudomonadota bacterium]
MSSSPLPPDRVPTLTEVVAWPGSSPAGGATSAAGPTVELAEPVEPGASPAPDVAAPAADAASITEEQLTQRILNDLQRQMDLMLDYRLREILTPLLTRAADTVVREARSELASTLRDVVARAVAQELTRHRTR